MKKFNLFVLTFLLLCGRSLGQTIYVSPSGSDGNSGTKESPLASLDGARDKVKTLRANKNLTDTVFVKIQEGTYFMRKPFLLSSEDGGTAKSPTVYTADANHRPRFCGGLKISGFKAVNPDLWRAYVPETEYGFSFEQLYVNGERRYRAQTPNRGEFYMPKRIEEKNIDTARNRTTDFAVQKIILRSENADILKDIAAGEYNRAVVVFYHAWDNSRKFISHLSVRDTAFFTSGRGMKPWNPINEKSRYVIENYRKALDAPGEWLLDRDGYLYYIPMPGETLETIDCIAPVTDKFMIIKGSGNQPVEHLRFENLSFETAGYLIPREGNEPAQAAAPIEASIMIDFASHIEFRNCEVAHTGLHAIWFRKQCSHSKIEHCRLYDLGGGGVKIGAPSPTSDAEATNHIVVHNSIIHHGGYVFPCSVGVVIFNGCDNEISNNDIADLRYSAISAGWVWGYAHSPSKRNTIINNHLHHLGWGELCDMGGVYTLGESEGTVVSNNHIHHIHSHYYGGWGLYTDEGSSGIVMEKNLVYACNDAGFHQHYGKENLIRNNIFAFNKRSQMQITRVEKHLSFSFTNNIIYVDNGLLYMSMGGNTWLKAQVNIDNNCYWDKSSKTPAFHLNIDFARIPDYFAKRIKTSPFNGMTFGEWQKSGRDKHSIVADPLFVNPDKFDFHFKNMSVAKKIGFQPFDYSKAGVYGDENWLKQAQLSPETLAEFDRRFNNN